VIGVIIVAGGTLIVGRSFLGEKEGKNVEVRSWELVREAVINCEAERVFQSHDLNVKVLLKNGSEITAVEPQIDDIINLAVEAQPKCGRIIMATE